MKAAIRLRRLSARRWLSATASCSVPGRSGSENASQLHQGIEQKPKHRAKASAPETTSSLMGEIAQIRGVGFARCRPRRASSRKNLQRLIFCFSPGAPHTGGHAGFGSADRDAPKPDLEHFMVASGVGGDGMRLPKKRPRVGSRARCDDLAADIRRTTFRSRQYVAECGATSNAVHATSRVRNRSAPNWANRAGRRAAVRFPEKRNLSVPLRRFGLHGSLIPCLARANALQVQLRARLFVLQRDPRALTR